VAHGNQSALFPAVPRDTTVLRSDIAVFRVTRRPSRLCQGLLSQRLPGVMRLLLRLSALSSLPGHMRAREAKCCSLGKGFISAPTSASSTSATAIDAGNGVQALDLSCERARVQPQPRGSPCGGRSSSGCLASFCPSRSAGF